MQLLPFRGDGRGAKGDNPLSTSKVLSGRNYPTHPPFPFQVYRPEVKFMSMKNFEPLPSK
ncbi:MAG: hypothetical protein K9G76_08715 [Bacteroidales bacterium]|nr:hypothetical protein [Bacteroidales bacterium]